MNIYKINITKSNNKYSAVITLNGRIHTEFSAWSTEEDARRDGNYNLTKIEQSNNDWNGDHSMSRYHYL